jgi:hypothetical protein
MIRRAARLWPWIVPPVFFLFVYSHGLRSWFQQDDFAWLLQWLSFESWRDLPRLLFMPQAQGTIRPWSERAFFLSGYGFFGLDPRPMHALVAVTQIGSLWLLASLTLRLAGSRLAAGLAPLIWVINPGLATPVSWLSTFNQVLCSFFLLASLTLFIRSAERRTLAATVSSFGVFLLGFGALEIHIVFPALALAWCLFFAPEHWKRTLPYWAVSLAYFVLHQSVAAKPTSGPYAQHWNLEMVTTLVRYYGTTLAGGDLNQPPWNLPTWAWIVAAWVAGIVLLGLAAIAWRRGQRVPAYGFVWFLFTVAPILPLRDHFFIYYLAAPSLGLALALAALLALPSRKLAVAAISVLVVELVFTFPVTRTIERWHYERGLHLKVLFEGLERAGQLHPGKTILLTGLNTETYWGGFFDGPHKLLGLNDVLLAPGSETAIESHPELGDMAPTIASKSAAAREVLWGRAVVYQVEESRLRNITKRYAKSIPEDWLGSHPRRIDLSLAAAAQDLGPGWYPPEGGSRWMAQKGVILLSGPGDSDRVLRVAGYVPAVCVKDGPLTVTITVDGARIGQESIAEQDLSFDFRLPAPPGLKQRTAVVVEIAVSRTYREPGGMRELGLSFGQVGWAPN